VLYSFAYHHHRYSERYSLCRGSGVVIGLQTWSYCPRAAFGSPPARRPARPPSDAPFRLGPRTGLCPDMSGYSISCIRGSMAAANQRHAQLLNGRSRARGGTFDRFVRVVFDPSHQVELACSVVISTNKSEKSRLVAGDTLFLGIVAETDALDDAGARDQHKQRHGPGWSASVR
jgi:hypothetical protein